MKYACKKAVTLFKILVFKAKGLKHNNVYLRVK